MCACSPGKRPPWRKVGPDKARWGNPGCHSLFSVCFQSVVPSHVKGCWPALSPDRPGLLYADARRPGFPPILLLPSHLPVRVAFYLPGASSPLCHCLIRSHLQSREQKGMACWVIDVVSGWQAGVVPGPPPRGYVHSGCPRTPPRGYVHSGCPRTPP